MEPIDILYTPLETDPIPKFDIDHLYDWISRTYPQNFIDEVPGSQVSRKSLSQEYPWDILWPKYGEQGWTNGFDKEFPQLADHICHSFNLTHKEVGCITMLPMRSDRNGLGFWHSDKDLTGLRMYLVNDMPDENPLFIRPTKIPYTIRPKEIAEIISTDLEGPHPLLSDTILTAKILSPTQAYYLNNIRAVHSPFVTRSARRIALIIQGTPFNRHTVYEKTKKLIVESAEKYKDYAILWEAE
jgi:hypothetical protein